MYKTTFRQGQAMQNCDPWEKKNKVSYTIPPFCQETISRPPSTWEPKLNLVALLNWENEDRSSERLSWLKVTKSAIKEEAAQEESSRNVLSFSHACVSKILQGRGKMTRNLQNDSQSLYKVGRSSSTSVLGDSLEAFNRDFREGRP